MRVAYLSYNPLSAPLVQSQVLPYLRHLVAKGHEFSLLTFERHRGETSQARQIETGIDWLPNDQSGTGPAVLFSMRRAMRSVTRRHASKPFDLIHARSYLPAMVARRAAQRLGIPWIFDMRGFWVDEKVMKGSLSKEGLAYRWLKGEERKLLKRANAIVSLTHRAVPRIEDWILPETLPPIVVIPTCTDLSRFELYQGGATPPQKRVFGYVGSLGSGYEGGMVQAFLAAALDRFPMAEALVVTHSDQALMEELKGRFADRVTVTRADHADMPGLVATMTVGLSFITPDPSKDASCPTKLGEYLACGVPVVSNLGIGDMDALISSHRVGVLCSDEREFDRAFSELEELLAQPAKLKNRCRACAESVFSVEQGAREYDALYRKAGDVAARAA